MAHQETSRQEAVALLQQSHRHNLSELIEAGRLLLRVGDDPNAYLYDALQTDDSDTRIKIIHVLLVTGNKQTPQHLLPFLGGGDVRVIAAVLEALAFGKAPQAFAEAIKFLHHENLVVGRAAISALRLLRVVEALPILVDYLAECEEPSMAKDAVTVVFELGGARPFIARWKDMGEPTKIRVLRAIQSMPGSESHKHDDAIHDLLAHILCGDEVNVMRSLLGTLRLYRHHTRRFTYELQQLSESDHPVVSDTAAGLLAELATPHQRPTLMARRQMKSMAERHVIHVRMYCGEKLNFTQRSIDVLDEIIDRGFPWVELDDYLRDIFFGSYLGEVVRINFGGEWHASDEDGYHIVIPGQQCTTVYPFEAVRRRFENGQSDSLGAFYSELRESVKSVGP